MKSSILFNCQVQLRTSMDLESLGRLLSTTLLGGIPMGGRKEALLDEVPAIYTEGPILGNFFILLGEPDEEGYYIRCLYDPASSGVLSAEEMKACTVDISHAVARQLRTIPGIEILNPTDAS